MRQKVTVLTACACALATSLVCAAQLRAESTTEPEPTPDVTTAATTTEMQTFARRDVQKIIDTYRRETWRWQRVMGRPLLVRLAQPPAEPGEKIAAWKRVAVRTRRRALNPPHKQAWLCIHRFEGSWADANAPYYGGLQMDLSFQRSYAPDLLRRKGTADHWTPLEQMWTAERAHSSGRGFYPWPNTARYCGLI
jgi:hypothetical protein